MSADVRHQESQDTAKITAKAKGMEAGDKMWSDPDKTHRKKIQEKKMSIVAGLAAKVVISTWTGNIVTLALLFLSV